MKTRYLGSCLVLILLAGIQDVCAKIKEESTPYEKAIGVFVPKQDNPYAAIRIPCIVNAGGTLIAVAEGRHSAGDQSNNDMIVSVSKNGGKTWSKPAVAAAADGGASLGNPCLLYDPEKKLTVLMYQRYPQGVSEQGNVRPVPGYDDPERTLGCFVVTSKDNGRHWSKPVDVTRDTRHEDCSITCSGPNPGVVLTQGPHKGRLVVSFNEAPGFGNWHITAAYSDDHGKTWKLGEKSESGKGVNEVSSAELPGGEVLVVSRSWGGSHRAVSVSSDGGETWGPVTAHMELPSPNCQNGLTRYSFENQAKYGNKSRLIFSGCQPGRKDGFIKMSYDDGKTWPVQKDIGPGAFAYSTLCTVKPGRVGLLFECENHTIKFTSFSIKWLTDGEDTGVGKEEK